MNPWVKARYLRDVLEAIELKAISADRLDPHEMSEAMAYIRTRAALALEQVS